MKKVFMFPGQGSCYPGILSETLQDFPEFNLLIEQADEISTRFFQKRVSTFIHESAEIAGKAGAKDLYAQNFDISQLVIFLTNYILAQVLSKNGVVPDFLVGHSFGEFSALAISGAVSFEDALKMVCFRTQALQAFHTDAGMLGLVCDSTRAQNLIDLLGLKSAFVANENSSSQTIVSGITAELNKVSQAAEALKMGTFRLNSAYPFHCQFMGPAVAPFYDCLLKIHAHSPRVTTFSPVLMEFYSDFAGAALAEHFARRLFVSKVQFVESLNVLHRKGARMFIEVGGRKALSSFAKELLGEADVHIFTTSDPKMGERTNLKSTLDKIREIEGAVPMSPSLPSSPTAQQSPLAAPSTDVAQRVVKIYQKLTDYPAEVFELHSDFESELGLDSVKQIQILGKVQEEFGFNAGSDVQIKEYNTLDKVVRAFVMPRISTETISQATAPAPQMPTVIAPKASTVTALSAVPAVDSAQVTRRVVQIYQKLTDYPEEVFELHSDFESELGLDSVKQIQILGKVQEEFGFNAGSDVQIKEYNTLDKVVRAFVMPRISNEALPQADLKSAQKVVSEPALDLGQVTKRVIQMYQKLTDYPEEVFELNADFESELGLDSVKQLQILGKIREEFGLAESADVQIKEFNTIAKVVEAFILPRLSVPTAMKESSSENLSDSTEADFVSEVQKVIFVVSDRLVSFAKVPGIVTQSQFLDLVAHKDSSLKSTRFYASQGLFPEHIKKIRQSISDLGMQHQVGFEESLPPPCEKDAVFKYKSENVLISRPTPSGERAYTSHLVIHDDCPEMSDHLTHGQHVPGIVILEATRQMGNACLYLYTSEIVPAFGTRDLNFFINEISVKYERYAVFLDIELRAKVQNVVMDTSGSATVQYEIEFIQMGNIVCTARYELKGTRKVALKSTELSLATGIVKMMSEKQKRNLTLSQTGLRTSPAALASNSAISSFS